MWASYHIDDPEEFYSGNDRWDVARDPGTADAGEGTQTTDSAGNIVSSREARIDPSSMCTRLPDTEDLDLMLTRHIVCVADRRVCKESFSTFILRMALCTLNKQ